MPEKFVFEPADASELKKINMTLLLLVQEVRV